MYLVPWLAGSLHREVHASPQGHAGLSGPNCPASSSVILHVPSCILYNPWPSFKPVSTTSPQEDEAAPDHHVQLCALMICITCASSIKHVQRLSAHLQPGNLRLRHVHRWSIIFGLGHALISQAGFSGFNLAATPPRPPFSRHHHAVGVP